MKTILSMDPVMKMACPPQRATPDAGFRLSSVCLSVPCQDGTLLYNNLTGELLLLTQEETAQLESSQALRKTLAEKWFLVPARFSEIDHVEQVRGISALLAQPTDHFRHFLIFPTTDCNARCFYCYELGGTRKTMTEETARDVARYIIEKCKGNPVILRWFGGEPLYNSRAIDIITEELRSAGIYYRSNILTNGYLISEEIADKIQKDWNTFSVQITLDGTEAVYNRTKAYYRCTDNAFLRVMDNIERLLVRKVGLHIRLNMDSNNAEDLKRLIQELAQRFGSYETFSVYVAPLRDWGQKIHDFASEEEGVARMRELNRLIEDLLPSPDYFMVHNLPITRCMADNDAYVTIMPDGKLGKCEHCYDSDYIGSIYSKEIDQDMVNAFKKRTPPWEVCKHCVTYSHCIMLEKCAEGKLPCSRIVRECWRDNLRKKVLSTWRAYRKGIASDVKNEEPTPLC